MNKSLIRFHKQLLWLLAPLFLFQNCIVEFAGEVQGRLTPADVRDIQYSVYGGYPGPNGPTYTSLSLATLANGEVSADLRTEACTTQGKALRSEFDRIVLNSTPVNSQQSDFTSMCADCSNVSLTFLDRNGTSHAMVAQSEAQTQIQYIIDRLMVSCTAPVATIRNLRYYRGGWYGVAPNWAHDFRIIFNADGSASVAGKDFDPLCFRNGALDRNQVRTLSTLVSGLKLMVSDGPQGADAGIELIDVQYTNGDSRTIHLMRIEAPSRALYASNPGELSMFLNGVGSNLSIGCQ